jgi:hypothetical protein
MLEADEPSMRALTAARSALHPFRALLDLGAIVGSRSECRITVAMLHDLAVARHEAFRRNRMNWRRLPRGCAA